MLNFNWKLSYYILKKSVSCAKTEPLNKNKKRQVKMNSFLYIEHLFQIITQQT